MAGISFDKISMDPMKRIPGSMLKILKRDNIFFDVHCHVFNYKDVPDKFIGIRIPYNRVFLLKIERFLHRIINRSESDPFSNLAWFIHFFKNSSPSEIANRLKDYYSGRAVVLCPLMMDMAPGIEGRIIDDYQVQIEKMRALRNLMPGTILPFFAADPNNSRLIENFLRVFSTTEEYNFFGIKIYPSLGYLPTHQVLMQLFEICEEKRIPVTSHCSGATVHTSKKLITDIQGYHLTYDQEFSDKPITIRFKKKKSYAEFFNHPHNWLPVLKRFPNLKLNLAHFGGEEQWEKYISGNKDNWVSYIISMINEYDNLYADFSYTLYYKKFFNGLLNLFKENDKLYRRILFGSDYYMIVREGQFNRLFDIFKEEMGEAVLKQMAMENPRQFLFG